MGINRVNASNRCMSSDLVRLFYTRNPELKIYLQDMIDSYVELQLGSSAELALIEKTLYAGFALNYIDNIEGINNFVAYND